MATSKVQILTAYKTAKNLEEEHYKIAQGHAQKASSLLMYLSNSMEEIKVGDIVCNVDTNLESLVTSIVGESIDEEDNLVFHLYGRKKLVDETYSPSPTRIVKGTWVNKRNGIVVFSK